MFSIVDDLGYFKTNNGRNTFSDYLSVHATVSHSLFVTLKNNGIQE